MTLVGEGSPCWFSINCSCQTDNNHSKCYILIFYITNFFDFFMTKSRVTFTISLFFLEKKSEIWNAFTFFREMKSGKVSFYSFQEKKSEMISVSLFSSIEYLEIEIGRWSLKKFSRILEKRDICWLLVSKPDWATITFSLKVFNLFRT